MTEQKLRPEVHFYLCFPFTHIVIWGRYDSSTDNTNLFGSISWNWHVHSCRTLNKDSIWVHHGTQAASSWMQRAATIQSLFLMLQWHAIISLSIPVTSMDGFVSFKERACICRVRFENSLRFLVTEEQSERAIHVSSRVKDGCVEVQRAYCYWPVHVCGYLLENQNRAHSQLVKNRPACWIIVYIYIYTHIYKP